MDSDPPFLPVGTEVSAKYKGAFCEAKIKKVVRVVKCKVTFKSGLGTVMLSDDQIKGTLRVGANVEARHPDKNAHIEAVINKIQDCSQYTVVFDDGDITTLRRSALCLKSGRHFNESETLDQLPLTHPEHFSNPVVGGRRNVRRRRDPLSGEVQEVDEESSDEESVSSTKKGKPKFNQNDSDVDIGKVVCVDVTDKKGKGKDNWFPGLIVSPSAQETVKIRTKDEYLVRSFRDGRYYTVPKKEITSFSKDSHAGKNDSNSNILKSAIDKAVQYIDKDELPQHWDKGILFSNVEDEPVDESEDVGEGSDSEDSVGSSQAEEKDRFVAQLYKYMDERGTPINKVPIVCNRDLDLYKLYKIVIGRGGYNKVTNSSQWKSVTVKMGFGSMPSTSTINLVKQGYKKFIHNFEEFNRKLGCNFPSGSSSTSSRSNRTIFRDRHASSSSKEIKPVPPVSKEAVPEIVEENSDAASTHEESTVPAEVPPVLTSVEEIETKKAEELNESPRRSRSRQDIRKLKEYDVVAEKPSVGKKRRNMKEKEEKEPPTKVVVDPPTPAPPPPPAATPPPSTTIPPKRGSGRGKYKRKTDKDEIPEPKVEPEEYPPDREFIDKDVQIQLGDKLSVYYGKESEGKKYEAKVVDINEKQLLYFVHYAGWNTRYDEWIPRYRVAENLSLRAEQVTSIPQGRGPQSSVSDGTASNSDSGSTFKGPTTKGPKKKLKLAVESMSTTRSKSASLTPRKRLSSEGDIPTVKRKTRKKALSGVESEGDSSGTESKTIPIMKRGKKSKKVVEVSGVEGADGKALSKSIPSPDISDFSKDVKDNQPDQVIDLNEIRSEMKGIDKMVKMLPPAEAASSASQLTEETKKSDVYDFEEENNQTQASTNVPIPPKPLEKKDEAAVKEIISESSESKDSSTTQVSGGSIPVKISPVIVKETPPMSSIDSSINSVVEAKDSVITTVPVVTAAATPSQPPQPVFTLLSPRIQRLAEPKNRPVVGQRPPPLLIRGFAPTTMVQFPQRPVRTTTPIAISIPARSQRPILIQSTSSPTVLPIATTASPQQSPLIVPLIKSSVAVAHSTLSKTAELNLVNQQSTNPMSTPTVTLITTTGRNTEKTQSNIQVRPKLIEGARLSSYPTARIKSGTNVLPIRTPIGIPPPSLPHPPSQSMNLGLKKKRKVKSQKFVESSGSSDEGPDKKKHKRQGITPKAQQKKISQPGGTGGIITSTPGTIGVIPVTMNTVASLSLSTATVTTPKKPPGTPKVTPIVKLKLSGEMKPMLTPGKILSKKYTRVEQPVKFPKKIVATPVSAKLTAPSSSSSTSVPPLQLQQTSVIVKGEQMTPKVPAGNPESRQLLNPETAKLQGDIPTIPIIKEEQFLPFKSFEAEKGNISESSPKVPELVPSGDVLTISADSSEPKLVSTKTISVTNEEESCHSLLCEEEIPGSPTPGTESKNFSFDDKTIEDAVVKKEFPSEKLVNPIPSNQPKEKTSHPMLIPPLSNPERVMPDVKEFAMFAEAKPQTSFQSKNTGMEFHELEHRENDDHLLELPSTRYPMDVDDQIESSPRQMFSSGSASSGSPRGGDVDGEGRQSGSGDNSKSKHSDTDSIECMQKQEAEDMGDENSSSDEGGGRKRKYDDQGSRLSSGGRSRSPSSSPRKRRMVRKGSPDESRAYRSSRMSSSRKSGLDAEYGRMPPPLPPFNLGKPPKCERLNMVIPELNDDMSQDERVDTVQGILEALRDKYKELKTTIAMLDRKKKRIRKREREKQKREKEALQAAVSDL